MKEIRKLVNGLVACGVALAMVSTLAAQTPVEGVGKVVRKKGAARYTTGNNVWQPLQVGDIVKPGTIIQTGKETGSFIDITLIDSGAPLYPSAAVYTPHIASSSVVTYQQPAAAQNVVRIFENSALGIDKLTSLQTGADQVVEVQLDLRAGRISGSVKKMSAASKYEVKLPNGVAGIRGTSYELAAEGVVSVYEGSVVLAYVGPDGSIQTQVVTAGHKFDPSVGLTPIPTGAPGKIPTYTTPVSTPVAGDRTIYYSMSPHKGGNDQGQNNNNQGQNQQ